MPRRRIFFLIALLCLGVPALAADASLAPIAVGQMAVQLFGGLALFLFGIEQMTEGLKWSRANACAGYSLVLRRTVTWVR